MTITPTGRRRNTVASSSAVLAACLMLAACSDDREERAATVTSTTEAGTVAAGTPTEAAPAPKSRAGRLLTKAEARAAVPVITDLPTGWSTDPERTVTKEDDAEESATTYSPASCAPLFEDLAADEDRLGQARAGATADFTRGGLAGPYLGVEVKSYADEVPDDVFAKVLAALSTCPKVTVKEKGEEPTTLTASALSFPNLGDSTVALRFGAETQGLPFGYDYVVIRIGHNLVTAGQIAFGGSADAAVLETVGRSVVTKLGG